MKHQQVKYLKYKILKFLQKNLFGIQSVQYKVILKISFKSKVSIINNNNTKGTIAPLPQRRVVLEKLNCDSINWYLFNLQFPYYFVQRKNLFNGK